MPSIYELALCSDAVYKDDDSAPENWTRVRRYRYPTTGMYAALFQKGGEYVLAFRGTETSLPDIFQDIDDDAMIAFGVMPKQFNSAKDAYAQAKNRMLATAPLILTGHSLGGGLAALVAAKVSADPVVTFNSPGMNNSAISQARRARQLSSLVQVRTAPSYYRYVYDLLFKVDELKLYGIKKHKALHIRSEMDVVSMGTGSRIAGQLRTVANDSCDKPQPMMMLSPAALVNTIKSSFNSVGCAHKLAKLLPSLAKHKEFTEEIEWSRYE